MGLVHDCDVSTLYTLLRNAKQDLRDYKAWLRGVAVPYPMHPRAGHWAETQIRVIGDELRRRTREAA